MIEDSGGSCEYYVVWIEYPTDSEARPYTAECDDIIEALDMRSKEANIFKEIWRLAAERQGRVKKGHTRIRGLEKIIWMAQRMLDIEKRKLEDQ